MQTGTGTRAVASIFEPHGETEAGGKDFKFLDGENITANAGITHTTAYSSDVASATTYTSPINIVTSTYRKKKLNLVIGWEKKVMMIFQII